MTTTLYSIYLLGGSIDGDEVSLWLWMSEWEQQDVESTIAGRTTHRHGDELQWYREPCDSVFHLVCLDQSVDDMPPGRALRREQLDCIVTRIRPALTLETRDGRVKVCVDTRKKCDILVRNFDVDQPTFLASNGCGGPVAALP